MSEARLTAQAPAESELTFESSDGWKLSVLCREPPGPAQGVVLLSHAMMANRRSLDRPAGRGLASTLGLRGLITYALDVRGHGRSGPRPAEGGNWSYDDIVFRDLPAAIEFVRSRHPGLPLGVLGHSLTAHGMLALLGQREDINGWIDALVSVSSNVWMPQIEPSRVRQVKKNLVLAGFGALTWPIGYYPAKRLGSGSEDVSKRFVDMFQALRRTGKWRSADGKIDYIAGLGRVRVPVLAVVGRGDTLLCHPECSLRYHRLLTGAQVWHWTVGRETGLNFDPDHMQVVTDERASAVWRGIGRWLEERFKNRTRPVEPGFVEVDRIP